MLVTDMKTQKIEPDPNFFMTDESFRGSVNMWFTQCEVVFIFLLTNISDENFGLSVQRPLGLGFGLR